MTEDCAQKLSLQSIHFCGAGWRLFYYLGICDYMQRHFGQDALKRVHYAGASVGAWIGLMMLTGTSARMCHQFWQQQAAEQLKRPTWLQRIDTSHGMMKMFDLYGLSEEMIRHLNRSNHFSVIVNRIARPMVIHQFFDLNDLYQALMASAFIPLITQKTFFYRYRGQYCFDGMFRGTHLQPDLMISTTPIKYDRMLCLKKPLGSSYYPVDGCVSDDLFDHGYQDAQDYFDPLK